MQHFRCVILDLPAAVELDFFIASFDQFSSATELHLDFLSAPRLLDSLRPGSAGGGLAWWSYKRLAASISDLTLNGSDLETTNAYQLISACTKLQNVTFLLGRLPKSPYNVHRLAGSLPHLESLTIRQNQEGDDAGDLPAEFLEPRARWPRLKKLNIISKELGHNTVKFVQLFADSLEDLSLSATSPSHSLLSWPIQSSLRRIAQLSPPSPEFVSLTTTIRPTVSVGKIQS